MKYPKAWLKASTVLAEEKVSKWWTELSQEARDEYVAEHPASKYADMRKAEKEKPDGHDSGHGDHGASETKKAEPKKFDPESPDVQPKAPIRTKLASFLKRKTADIVSHLKHEAKEWKAAGSALSGLARGRPLDGHGKKAIASVASDVAITVTALLTAGWAAHGIAAFMSHMGTHLAQEALMKSAIKGALHHASVKAGNEDDMDRIVKDAVASLIDTIENGDLKALMADRKVTARIDMSADIAGKGLCPECKKPMEVVTAGTSKVWACAADRISIPVPNGYETKSA